MNGRARESRHFGRRFSAFRAEAGGLGRLGMGAGELGWQGGRRRGKGRREERENGRGREEGWDARGKKKEEKEKAGLIRPVRSGPVRFCRFDSKYKILNFYSALGPKMRSKNFEKISENSEKFVDSKYIFSFATWSLN